MDTRRFWIRGWLVSALALALLLSPTSLAVADPGDLDPSFGDDGKIITRIGTGFWTGAGSSVAIQPDRKIVVAGRAGIHMDSDFAVARYLPDGSLDASFDGDGSVMTDFAAANDTASGLALQKDGKIVVAGNAYTYSNRDFALARYNADGSFDTTFDGDGKVMTAIGGADDELTAVAIQSDQKIVVAGRTSQGANSDVALARYEADGSLDASFGTNGIVVSSIISGDDGVQDIQLQADGKIVVVGDTYDGTEGGFLVARYNDDGSLDHSFGGDGTVVGSYLAAGYAVAIQANGRIVAVGYSYDPGSGTSHDFAFVRLNADGSVVDQTSTPIASNGNDDEGTDVAIQSDGKIVVAGAVRPDTGGGWDGFAVARYLGEPPPPMTNKTYLPLVLNG